MIERLHQALLTPLPLWMALVGSLALAAAVLLLARLIRKKRDPDGAARPAGQRIAVGKLHEQGAREGQQDCFGVSDEALIPTHGLLAVVADGMGGLTNGDKVSQTAVEAVLDTFLACRGGEEPERLLLALARSAAEAVGRLLGPEGARESGSTLVMGLVRDRSLSFLSVGDSRICLWRSGVLTQLNREHIFQRELALRAVNGELTLPEVYASPKGAGLTSFLGMGKLTQIDFPAGPVPLLPGDRLVLMSDGVYNALSDEELKRALAEEPEQAAEEIRRAIREKDYQNQDNYTAVILALAPDGD